MSKFKKGQSGNPKGRPPLSKEARYIKDLSSGELKRVAELLFTSTRSDLHIILNDSASSNFECVAASIILKSIQKGEMGEVNELLNRTIGKVSDKVEVKLPVPTVINRLNGSQVVLTARRDEEEE